MYGPDLVFLVYMVHYVCSYTACAAKKEKADEFKTQKEDEAYDKRIG